MQSPNCTTASNINKTIETIEAHSWCLERYESVASYCPGCLLGIAEWCLGAILRNHCCQTILESESECHLKGLDRNFCLNYFFHTRSSWSACIVNPPRNFMKFNHFLKLPQGFLVVLCFQGSPGWALRSLSSWKPSLEWPRRWDVPAKAGENHREMDGKRQNLGDLGDFFRSSLRFWGMKKDGCQVVIHTCNDLETQRGRHCQVEKDKSRPLARPDKCYRKVSVSRRGFSSSLFRLLISVRWRWRKREIRRRRIVVVYLDIDGYWLYLSLYIHYIQISLWSISLSRFFSRQRDNAHRFEKDWAERRVPAHLVPEAGPPKVTIPMMVHRVGGCWFG